MNSVASWGGKTMPVYEFRCSQCGFEFERIVFATDKEGVVCPRCDAPDAERLLSTFCSTRSGGDMAGTGGTSCGTSTTGFS